MLKSFIYTAELKSLTKAAEVLLLPVSSVSRYISELEEALEYNLLNKTKGKISLTPNGERLYRQANKHLRALEKAMLNIEVEQEVIRFATYSSAVSYIAPILYKKMRTILPSKQLQISIMAKHDCEESIRKGLVDIGFYAYYKDCIKDKAPDLIYKPSGIHVSSFVVSADNPFSKKHPESIPVSLKQIAKDKDLYNKFFYTSSFMFPDMLELNDIKNSYLKIDTNTGIDVLKRFIIENQGCGIFSKNAIHPVERHMFKFYTIEENTNMQRYICYKNHNPVIKKVCNLITGILSSYDIS